MRNTRIISTNATKMAAKSARVIGTLALLASTISIGVNETRLLRAQRSLEEGRRRALALAKPELDARNDGQLVLFAGAITTNAVVLDSAGHALANTRSPIVMDPEFGVAVRGVRLTRTVEMLQWVETVHTTSRHTTDDDDLDDERERVYLYDLRWRADRVDSTQFDNPSYANPWEHGVPWRFESKVVQASDVVVGDFPLSDALLDQIKRRDAVALDAASRRTMRNVLDQRLGEDWSARSALQNVTLDDEEKYFFVRPLRDHAEAHNTQQMRSAPELGDLRVSFTVTPAYAVTVCAQQQQQSLVPFATSASESIYLLEDGVHSVADFFDLETDVKVRVLVSPRAKNESADDAVEFVLTTTVCCVSVDVLAVPRESLLSTLLERRRLHWLLDAPPSARRTHPPSDKSPRTSRRSIAELLAHILSRSSVLGQRQVRSRFVCY